MESLQFVEQLTMLGDFVLNFGALALMFLVGSVSIIGVIALTRGH